MKLSAFTIYDAAAKAYLPPFFLPTQQMAIRTFRDCANDSSHAFFRNPTDYTLYACGEFDDSTGIIAEFITLESLGNADQYRDISSTITEEQTS